MTIGQDLFGGPPPTHIPSDGSDALFAAGKGADEVAKAFPASPLPWAMLADEAWAQGRVLESYAFARTGYHRGLDLLRRSEPRSLARTGELILLHWRDDLESLATARSC